jgi:predicted nucleic acid-binding protein
VDSSAFIAAIDGDDARHTEARRIWMELLESEEPLATTNYVMLETLAVAQSRLGVDAVAALADSFFPQTEVMWVMESDHFAALGAVLAARRRQLSLVDCASFVVMHRQRMTRCFTFDRHFAEMGFECLS